VVVPAPVYVVRPRHRARHGGWAPVAVPYPSTPVYVTAPARPVPPPAYPPGYGWR
jgi:hypothetical protein